mmetsp:Transcript_57704/g.67351  ORF Transcript_57704/g.67351 Transcript_57704/m.67351 type:complete len:96 (+) Transcript_57704:69-356(+)
MYDQFSRKTTVMVNETSDLSRHKNQVDIDELLDTLPYLPVGGFLSHTCLLHFVASSNFRTSKSMYTPIHITKKLPMKTIRSGGDSKASFLETFPV